MDSATPRLDLDLKMLGGVLAALLSVAVGFLPASVSVRLPWRHPSPHVSRQSLRPIVAYETAMVVEQVKRKVYPYSIVPGGAQDVNQARWYMAEPAIKVNYTSINLSQLKQERLKTNLTGYVSYRWGEKIYWTARKVTLRAGETVFTDGVHIVRGRCLNCYSALPMLPIRPHEPTEITMDTPVEMPVTTYSFPMLPVSAPELPIPPGELTPTAPALPAAPTPTAGKPPGGIWFPIIPIIPPIHHHPGQPTPGPPPPVPPVPPVVVVPEPRYGWALAVGFLVIIAAYRLRRIPVNRQ